MKVDIDQSLRQALGMAASTQLAARLYPELECGTCGQPLGHTMAVLVGQLFAAAPPAERWIVTSHHKRCRASGADRSGIVRISGASQYTGVTFLVPISRAAATATARPARRRWLPWRRAEVASKSAGGAMSAMPVAVVNPSLDTMIIEPKGDGSFVDVSIEQFRGRGWRPMRESGPGQPGEASARIAGDELSVDVGMGAVWSLPSVPEINERVQAMGGILVAATHDVSVGQLVAEGRPSVLFNSDVQVYSTWASLAQ